MSSSSRTTSHRFSRRPARVLGVLPLAAVAVLAAAGSASALPVGGGGGGSTPPPPPPNAAPVARFVVSPNPALVSPQLNVAQRLVGVGGGVSILDQGDTVKFDAGASTDDHGITKYEWDLDGNGTYDATGKTTSRRYTATGVFTVKLRVTDAGGRTGTVTHAVRIHQPPKARLSVAPTVLIGQTLTVLAKDSTDDNGIAKFEYDLDGNGTYETVGGPEANTSFTTLGSHRVGVRVTDVYGATATASATTIVHRAPTAAFTDAPSPAFVGEQVTFDGSTSSDDEPIAKYEWDLDGDGTYETTSTGPTATHTYTTAGARTILLRVTDSHGVQDVVAHALQVSVAPPAGTAAAAADKSAPKVRVSPRTVKLSKKGVVSVKVTCPATERSCTGRLSLRTKGPRSKAVGSKAFRLGGGQTAALKVKVSRAARKTIKRHTLTTSATAKATDASRNTGTTKTTVKIKK